MKTSDIEYVRLDVPREQIVLSDAIAWEFIMTGEYYSASDTLEALDIELENFRNLNVFERVYTIKRSWERAFDVDPYADLNEKWVSGLSEWRDRMEQLYS